MNGARNWQVEVAHNNFHQVIADECVIEPGGVAAFYSIDPTATTSAEGRRLTIAYAPGAWLTAFQDEQ